MLLSDNIESNLDNKLENSSHTKINNSEENDNDIDVDGDSDFHSEEEFQEWDANSDDSGALNNNYMVNFIDHYKKEEEEEEEFVSEAKEEEKEEEEIVSEEKEEEEEFVSEAKEEEEEFVSEAKEEEEKEKEEEFVSEAKEEEEFVSEAKEEEEFVSEAKEEFISEAKEDKEEEEFISEADKDKEEKIERLKRELFDKYEQENDYIDEEEIKLKLEKVEEKEEIKLKLEKVEEKEEIKLKLEKVEEKEEIKLKPKILKKSEEKVVKDKFPLEKEKKEDDILTFHKTLQSIKSKPVKPIEIDSIYDNWEYVRVNNKNEFSNDILDFDWKQYLSNYDDIKKTIFTKEMAWYHWINHGKKEGRTFLPLDNISEKIVVSDDDTEMYNNFDWKQYVKNYNDLHGDDINTKERAWYHWSNYGKFEGRTYFCLNTDEFDNFNWKEYTFTYNDLQNIGIDTKEKAWHHWTNHGKFEGRTYFSTNTNEFDNFNWKEYISNYNDLQDDTINNKEKAWYHWINHGKFEGRTYFSLNTDELDNFNWSEYVKHYDDLFNDGVDTKEKAWYHWIHHGKSEGRVYFTLLDEDEYENFDWTQYVANYDDLNKNGVDTKEKAWHHWINYGREEGRVTTSLYQDELNEYTDFELIPVNNILFKQKYNRYGNHYFGWQGVIQNWINYFTEMPSKKYIHQIFFDEWLEKLLTWGNKVINDEYLEQITNNNYKMVTFLHNPPFLEYKNLSLHNKIATQMILNDDSQLNENIFNEMERKQIEDNILLLYTLSNNHKEYLHNKYPEFKSKIVSVHHPIDLKTDQDKFFNIEKFLNNKKIYNIGWWLRNFKTFIDFDVPQNFKKIILVKKDFEKNFNNKICKHNNMRGIEILYELTNSEYENIFNSSCIFADIVDCSANNTILECIKFHTPIILRRNKSAEEYLGPNYPLFFNNLEELMVLNEEIFMLDLIVQAHYYLKNMNKHHIELETFNKKIQYDLNKFSVTSYSKKLMWVCFIQNENNFYIEKLLRSFVNQTDVEHLTLLLFVSFENEIINRYITLFNNINMVLISEKNYDFSFLQKIAMVSNYITTPYITIVNLNTVYKIDFSKIFIDYLEIMPSCDIGISNYTNIKNNKEDEFIDHFYLKDQILLSPYEDNIITVWRSDLLSLINSNDLEETMNDYSFWKHCLQNHLNMMCVSDKILYSIYN